MSNITQFNSTSSTASATLTALQPSLVPLKICQSFSLPYFIALFIFQIFSLTQLVPRVLGQLRQSLDSLERRRLQINLVSQLLVIPYIVNEFLFALDPDSLRQILPPRVCIVTSYLGPMFIICCVAHIIQMYKRMISKTATLLGAPDTRTITLVAVYLVYAGALLTLSTGVAVIICAELVLSSSISFKLYNIMDGLNEAAVVLVAFDTSFAVYTITSIIMASVQAFKSMPSLIQPLLEQKRKTISARVLATIGSVGAIITGVIGAYTAFTASSDQPDFADVSSILEPRDILLAKHRELYNFGQVGDMDVLYMYVRTCFPRICFMTGYLYFYGKVGSSSPAASPNKRAAPSLRTYPNPNQDTVNLIRGSVGATCTDQPKNNAASSNPRLSAQRLPQGQGHGQGQGRKSEKVIEMVASDTVPFSCSSMTNVVQEEKGLTAGRAQREGEGA